MDALRTPLPPLSRPVRLGQPYHGLIRGNVLTLSTGKTVQWAAGGVPGVGGTRGDCYVLRVPGTPPVGLAASELASEAAAGREWRDYALLTGRTRNYAGINVGTKAWLYADPDGAVWRIECDMLDGVSLVPTRLYPDQEYGAYPATADFTFTVRRFGVIDPADPAGASTPARVITLAGQSLGAAHASDPMYWEGFPAYALRLRHYPGDGVTRQWMPINIEDINSTGGWAVFCVNRTAEQSAIAGTDGRAVPKAWLQVVVSGVGLDGISIAMDVLRVQPKSVPTLTSSASHSSAKYVWNPAWVGPGQPITERSGSTDPSSLPGWPDASDVDVITGVISTNRSGVQVVGAYFDHNDDLQWVESGDSVAAESLVGSGSSTNSIQSFPGSRTNGDITYYWVDFLVNIAGSGKVDVIGECAPSVGMGPHAYTVPAMSWTITSTRSWSSAYVPYSGGSTTVSGTYSMSISGGALGDYSYSNMDSMGANEPAPVGGAVAFDQNNSLGVSGSGHGVGTGTFFGGWHYGGVLLRELDGLVLVRVTNKVYAVVALGPVHPHSASAPQFPTGTKVVALGTPDGWIAGGNVGLHFYAAYQPVTGEVAHSDGSVGWV